MNFFGRFFGSKKPQEKELKAKTSQKEREPSPIPTMMHYDLDTLRKYVDKRKPVLIIGGEYNQSNHPKSAAFSTCGKTLNFAAKKQCSI